MLTVHSQPRRVCSGLTRRELLQVGGTGLLGLSLPKLWAAEALTSPWQHARAKSVIFLFLFGGPSQLETFDLKPTAPEKIRGPFRPIAARTPGLRICEHLPRLAKIMDKLVPIRTMYGSPNGNHDSFICYTGRSFIQQPPGGWPSVGIRGTPATPSAVLDFQEQIKPIEQHGFILADFSTDKIVLRFFNWDVKTQPVEAIDTLQAFHTAELVRLG